MSAVEFHLDQWGLLEDAIAWWHVTNEKMSVGEALTPTIQILHTLVLKEQMGTFPKWCQGYERRGNELHFSLVLISQY